MKKHYFQAPIAKENGNPSIKEVEYIGSDGLQYKGVQFEGWASTEDRDRGGDVTLATSFLNTLPTYMENAIIFLQHDENKPIGNIVEARIEEGKGLYVKGIIKVDTDEVFKKVRTGVIKTMSFGYRVNDFEVKDEEEEGKITRTYVIKEVELFEISLVSVPMNANAQLKNNMSDEEYKKAFKIEAKMDYSLSKSLGDAVKELEENKQETVENGEKIIENEKKQEEIIENSEEIKENQEIIKEEKKVNTFDDTPLADVETEWDGTEAEKRVREWATSNDEIDWNKYKKAFAWYDEANKETLGAYKLGIKDIIDSELKTVWRGVSAAMGALLGARGGVNIPEDEKEGVYNLLSKYYEQFEKTVPEFKSMGEDEEWDDEKGCTRKRPKKSENKIEIKKLMINEIQIGQIVRYEQKPVAMECWDELCWFYDDVKVGKVINIITEGKYMLRETEYEATIEDPIIFIQKYINTVEEGYLPSMIIDGYLNSDVNIELYETPKSLEILNQKDTEIDNGNVITDEKSIENIDKKSVVEIDLNIERVEKSTNEMFTKLSQDMESKQIEFDNKVNDLSKKLETSENEVKELKETISGLFDLVSDLTTKFKSTVVDGAFIFSKKEERKESPLTQKLKAVQNMY